MTDLATSLETIAAQARSIATLADTAAQQSATGAAAALQPDFFITGLTVFALACFVGYYVVWRVTPALHSPLMAVTNAISSVVIVGAVLAAGQVDSVPAQWLGFAAVTLASVNIFGGFAVTRRMLGMYKKRER